ncbi:MAG: RNA polymerase sigma factor SigE [Thermocrispum sp.]
MEVPQLQTTTSEPLGDVTLSAERSGGAGGRPPGDVTLSAEPSGGAGGRPPGDVTEISADDAAWTPPSWDEIVRTHAPRVYRLAYRLAGNPHDAEDLTQETFIRVFRSLSSYKPGTFEGWLHRITTNLFLDMARRRSRVRMEGLPEDTDRIIGDDPSPEQVYSDTHLDPDLQAALDELPPEFRAAVVLCDVEGLSYEEIGATLGVKLGTVRSRIHRGRQALRATLERRRPQQHTVRSTA